MLHPDTDDYGLMIGAEPIEMNEEWSYFELLKYAWSKQESFIVLEQDVVPTLKDHRQMLTCSCLFCASSYNGPGSVNLTRSLGFSRFRREIMLDHPDLFDKIEEHKDAEPFNPRDWRRLDMRIVWQLGSPHIHPQVEHRHDYSVRR